MRERAGRAKAGKGSVETVSFYQKKSGVLLDALAEVLRRSPSAAIFLREVQASLVDDFIAQRRTDGVKENTIQKELVTWIQAMKLAKRRKWWRGDLAEVFPSGFSPEYKARERFVHPDEFLKLHDAMVRPFDLKRHDMSPDQVVEVRARYEAGENKKVLAKAFGTTAATLRALADREWSEAVSEVRGHELFAIVCYSIATSAEWSAIWRARRGDVQNELTKVFVRGSKNKRRERDVPIALFAFGVLLEFALRHGDGMSDGLGDSFLFAGSHAAAFRRNLGRACKRAGIPHISPNDLRRTHAKWLRLSGVELGNIFPSMGHADDRMLQLVYAKSSAMELAHLQAAQIAKAPGMLMGLPTANSGPQGSPPSSDEPANPLDLQCPLPESNQGHGDFQSDDNPRERSGEGTDLPTTWDANGIGGAATSTGSPEPEEPPRDAPVPVGTGGPGIARVSRGAEGVRVEVDGRRVARAEAAEGEPIAELEERLKAAVGRAKGGLQ